MGYRCGVVGPYCFSWQSLHATATFFLQHQFCCPGQLPPPLTNPILLWCPNCYCLFPSFFFVVFFFSGKKIKNVIRLLRLCEIMYLYFVPNSTHCDGSTTCLLLWVPWCTEHNSVDLLRLRVETVLLIHIFINRSCTLTVSIVFEMGAVFPR